jgi:ribonuclease HIII
MKILIDISPEHYDRLLSEFTDESRIYAILKNGVVIHHFETGDESRTVEILCDKFHARMILAAAEMVCPEAVAKIEEAIRLSRTLH